eukprot:CAMPEP_0170266194 /NCGR_PEP_ID=MMETSP0116_2-20130129/33010_1 /TAXON_ID=400756 /ORGANISM="Durinskia baltica, Strain CSIRO CS-38" /LENGTH=129 /DNA_ID=CAMNT_0010517323 /DNA_START=122 /DNA_END=508 /DNA_ORIENTATION=-
MSKFTLEATKIKGQFDSNIAGRAQAGAGDAQRLNPGPSGVQSSSLSGSGTKSSHASTVGPCRACSSLAGKDFLGLILRAAAMGSSPSSSSSSEKSSCANRCCRVRPSPLSEYLIEALFSASAPSAPGAP